MNEPPGVPTASGVFQNELAGNACAAKLSNAKAGYEMPGTFGASSNPSVNQSAHSRPRAESPATNRGVRCAFQTAAFGKP